MMLAALAAAASCVLPAGWPAVDARHTPYIVLGETHGTQSGPATLATIACALTARRERVLVAVEQNATDDAALHAAWALSVSDDFAVAVPKALHWQGRQDGDGSRAMLAALVRLHRLKTQGRAIDIVAFNGVRDDAQAARFKDLRGQGQQEAAQADNIRRVALADRYDHVLVLVGNLHARKSPVVSGDVSYRPMTMQLAPPDQVTSLILTSAAGAMWNCIRRPGATIAAGQPIPDDAIACGPHATRGDGGGRRFPSVAIGAAPGYAVGLYDGALYTGPAIASPPVLPGKP